MSGIKKDFIVRRTITEVEGKPVVTTYCEEELVRCGDCEFLIDHYGFMDDGFCKNMREKYHTKFMPPNNNWFCADGIRRISE